MRRIIKLTESDLTRIVRRVLKEAKDDETQYHRYQEGENTGIEPFLADPMNQSKADELQHQLEIDTYAKGPELLRKTNIGKGTGKLFIFFNGRKLTPSQFILQIQEDASKGICHTINTYEYNNRVLSSTKITITTNEGDCKKTPVSSSTTKTPTTKKSTKKCKHTKNIKIDNVRLYQKNCITNGRYYAEYTDGSKKTCTEIDGIIGCCTATCYAKSGTNPPRL